MVMKSDGWQKRKLIIEWPRTDGQSNRQQVDDLTSNVCIQVTSISFGSHCSSFGILFQGGRTLPPISPLRNPPFFGSQPEYPPQKEVGRCR